MWNNWAHAKDYTRRVAIFCSRAATPSLRSVRKVALCALGLARPLLFLFPFIFMFFSRVVTQVEQIGFKNRARVDNEILLASQDIPYTRILILIDAFKCLMTAF